MPHVLIVRGHQATPWELRPWQELPERFEVSYLLTRSNRFESVEGLKPERVRALRDLLPRGAVGEIGSFALGDRYLSGEQSFARAEIVHAEELSYWFAAEAARRKARHGFKLVQTVWETLPHMDAYRNRHARRNRQEVLAHTDLFLPATERAARALHLEGVPAERILVCPPGIDTERFARPAAGTPPAEHTIVSPGRLVWEKGHHDVLRAVAALHRGIVTLPGGATSKPRLLLIGSGPEEARLRAHAGELGLAEFLDIRAVPYEQMPAVFAGASAMVLASLSSATAAYHPLDLPRAFWEEQFGYVLAEAMGAGLTIVASTNGAIPEVLAGVGLAGSPGTPAESEGSRAVAPMAGGRSAGEPAPSQTAIGRPVDLVAPGDWLAIAQALAAGPLNRPPATRVSHPPEVLQLYSIAAAAQRLAEAYERVLAS